ncbi:MAG: hypothetical protein HY079_01075 [Elusimicrobia bacterium]|nr:hypothetical protein [Elusimicrobiota bacterium]
MTAPRRWLHSAAFDLGWFAAPPLLAALAVLLIPALRAPETPPWGWLVFVVFVDVGHVYASLWRTVFDPDEWARRRGLYLALPLVLWCAGAVLYMSSPLAFWRALAYLAVFHFVRQQYGFMRAYAQAEGPKPAWERRLEAAAVYATMLYPLVYWHADPTRRFWWFVQGDFVALRGAAGPWAGWLYAAVLGAFAVRQGVRVRAGLAVSAGKLAVVGATAVAWYVGIVATNSDFAFTLTNVVAHGVPYYALVWLYGRRRWTGKDWRASLHEPALALAFVGLLLAFAYLEEGVWDLLVWKEHAALFFGAALDWSPSPEASAVLIPLLALPQAAHYLSDSWLWKFDGSNPGLSEALFGWTKPPVRAIIPGPS